MGPEGRFALQLRAEFVNIFRLQIGNPSTTAPGAAPSKNAYGQYSAGFGVVNLTVSGPQTAPSYTLNAVVGQLYQLPRTGTLIARFLFRPDLGWTLVNRFDPAPQVWLRALIANSWMEFVELLRPFIRPISIS